MANCSFELNSFSLLLRLTVVVDDFLSWTSIYLFETGFDPVIFYNIFAISYFKYLFYLYNSWVNGLSCLSMGLLADSPSLLLAILESPCNFSFYNS